MLKISQWVGANRLECLLLAVILFSALFFRLWKIDQYMTFLGDEGRDALVVKQLIGQIQFQLTGASFGDHKWTLIGPSTSIGNIYLGPLYYYLMVIPMFLAGLSPIGPAVMVALIGTLTVFLVWLVAREMFSGASGVVAASLYAFSPVAIHYSKSSWNPNPMPFFALLCVFACWRVLSKQQYSYLPVALVSLAFALQMHYLGLLLIPIIGIFWLMALVPLYKSANSQQVISRFLLYSLVGLLLFTMLMSPLVLFDLRHGGNNYRAVASFFTSRETTVNINPFNALGRVPDLYVRLFFTRYIGSFNQLVGWAAGVVVFVFMIYKTFRMLRHKTLHLGFFMVSTWLVVGMVGMSLYKQGVFDHYFGFVAPAPFLLLGACGQFLWKRKAYLIVIALITILLLVAALRNPNLLPPNRQLQRTQAIVAAIIKEVDAQPFNFALIAQNNYDAAYQYYLDLWGHTPKTIDAQRLDETVTDQLIVVCEDAVCNPVGHPKWEIAGFGWSKIDKQWQVMGTTVYKLAHFYPDKNTL